MARLFISIEATTAEQPARDK